MTCSSPVKATLKEDRPPSKSNVDDSQEMLTITLFPVVGNMTSHTALLRLGSVFSPAVYSPLAIYHILRNEDNSIPVKQKHG